MKMKGVVLVVLCAGLAGGTRSLRAMVGEDQDVFELELEEDHEEEEGEPRLGASPLGLLRLHMGRRIARPITPPPPNSPRSLLGASPNDREERERLEPLHPFDDPGLRGSIARLSLVEASDDEIDESTALGRIQASMVGSTPQTAHCQGTLLAQEAGNEEIHSFTIRLTSRAPLNSHMTKIGVVTLTGQAAGRESAEDDQDHQCLELISAAAENSLAYCLRAINGQPLPHGLPRRLQLLISHLPLLVRHLSDFADRVAAIAELMQATGCEPSDAEQAPPRSLAVIRRLP